MAKMAELADHLIQSAAAVIRRSDETDRMRVFMARAFAKGLSEHVAGFNLERFLDDCFAADVVNGLRFEVEDTNMWAGYGGQLERVANSLSEAEAAAFRKLMGAEVVELAARRPDPEES